MKKANLKNLFQNVCFFLLTITLVSSANTLKANAATPAVVEELTFSITPGTGSNDQEGVWVTINEKPLSTTSSDVDWFFIAYPTLNSKPLPGELLIDRPAYAESPYITWGNPFFISKNYADTYGPYVEVFYVPVNQSDNMHHILKWGALNLDEVLNPPETASAVLSAAEETMAALHSMAAEVLPAGVAWEPTTPEEIEQYSYVGHDEPIVENANISSLTAVHSVQGPECIKSIKSVLGDWSIARTYNIFPAESSTEEPLYNMGQTARITIAIPETLRKEGRKFSMVCVSEGGEATTLHDIDASSDSITFDTNRFYAYALTYID